MSKFVQRHQVIPMAALARMRLSLIATLCFAAGCMQEPVPGELIDVREVNSDGFRLRLELRAEGNRVNPWQGQHLSLYCALSSSASGSERTWRKITPQGYFVERGLTRAPIGRIVVHASGFVFTDLFGGALFSFDACRSTHRWLGLPERYDSRRANDNPPGYVKSVEFCPEGDALAFEIEPAVFRDGSHVRVMSADRGRTWSYLEGAASTDIPCATEIRRGELTWNLVMRVAPSTGALGDRSLYWWRHRTRSIHQVQVL